MKLKKFTAKDFRNIEEAEIRFHDGVNLLFGRNAQGKTNAIEGIYLFARGKSFRKAKESDMIRFGCEGFRTEIAFETEMGEESLSYTVFGGERRRMKNGYKIDRVTEMIGSFRAVLFTPDRGGGERHAKFHAIKNIYQRLDYGSFTCSGSARKEHNAVFKGIRYRFFLQRGVIY